MKLQYILLVKNINLTMINKLQLITNKKIKEAKYDQ